MSLRYKILAAVIGINVVILFATFATVFLETLTRVREDRTHKETLLREIETWAVENWKLRAEGGAQWDSPAVFTVYLWRLPDTDRGDLGTDRIVENLGGERLDRGKIEGTVWPLVRDAVRAARPVRDVDSGIIVIPRPDLHGTPSSGEVPADASRTGLYIEAEWPGVRDPMLGLKTIYIAMMLGTVLLMVVTYTLVSRVILRPTESLVTAANRIARGDYSEPVPSTNREDEIETLIEAFNAMMVEVSSYRQHLEDRVQDATRQVKLAEKNLTIAQRLAATGKLASGIAHEVNNPLGGMINAARRLRAGTLPPEKQQEYFEIIEDGLERVRETVKKILQFTPHRVKPQAVDLRLVLDRSLALIAHRAEKSRAEIRVDVPADELTVFGDPFELQQVFLNLLLNALDALDGAGRPGQVEIVGENPPSGEIGIHVADNGCGMDEQAAAAAFDLFHTTKEAGTGTGLGLSIVHNIVTNHGGRIEVHSRPEQGTTFTVWLPRLAPREDGA